MTNNLSDIDVEIKRILLFMEMEVISARREIEIGGWLCDHNGALRQMNEELQKLLDERKNSAIDAENTVSAQTAAALIELESMKAENKERERHGYALAWNEDAFLSLITKYGLEGK